MRSSDRISDVCSSDLAVYGVSIEVAAGEIVGIIGPNGAVKTTLFDLLSGYLPPDRGRIYLGDTEITAAGPDERARAGLGRSFQDARLFPGLTVEEAIGVACERWVEVRDPMSAALRMPWLQDSEATSPSACTSSSPCSACARTAPS